MPQAQLIYLERLDRRLPASPTPIGSPRQHRRPGDGRRWRKASAVSWACASRNPRQLGHRSRSRTASRPTPSPTSITKFLDGSERRCRRRGHRPAERPDLGRNQPRRHRCHQRRGLAVRRGAIPDLARALRRQRRPWRQCRNSSQLVTAAPTRIAQRGMRTSRPAPHSGRRPLFSADDNDARAANTRILHALRSLPVG